MHPSAKLTPAGRRILVERIASGRPAAHVAAEMGVARKTASKPGSTEPATRFGCRDTQTGAPLKLG